MALMKFTTGLTRLSKGDCHFWFGHLPLIVGMAILCVIGMLSVHAQAVAPKPQSLAPILLTPDEQQILHLSQDLLQKHIEAEQAKAEGMRLRACLRAGVQIEECGAITPDRQLGMIVQRLPKAEKPKPPIDPPATNPNP